MGEVSSPIKFRISFNEFTIMILMSIDGSSNSRDLSNKLNSIIKIWIPIIFLMYLTFTILLSKD